MMTVKNNWQWNLLIFFFLYQWDKTEFLMPPFCGVLIEYCVTEYQRFLISRQDFERCKLLPECVLPLTVFPRKAGTT